MYSKKKASATSIFLEYPNKRSKTNPFFVGKGRSSPSTSDCVLIFDGEKFILERVSTSFTGIKLKPSKQKTNLNSILNQSIDSEPIPKSTPPPRTTSSSLHSIGISNRVNRTITKKPLKSSSLSMDKTSTVQTTPVAVPIQVQQPIVSAILEKQIEKMDEDDNDDKMETSDSDDSSGSEWDTLESTLVSSEVPNPLSQPIQLPTGSPSSGSEEESESDSGSDSESEETDSGESDSESAESDSGSD